MTPGLWRLKKSKKQKGKIAFKPFIKYLFNKEFVSNVEKYLQIHQVCIMISFPNLKRIIYK